MVIVIGSVGLVSLTAVVVIYVVRRRRKEGLHSRAAYGRNYGGVKWSNGSEDDGNRRE